MTTKPACSTERQIPAWAHTVGTGWRALLERLHYDLVALDADYRVEAFGTQFGGLRISVGDRFIDGEFDGEFADRATALTDAAESASEHTCEICGAEGRIRLRGDEQRTWMQASCKDCRTAPPSRHVRGSGWRAA